MWPMSFYIICSYRCSSLYIIKKNNMQFSVCLWVCLSGHLLGNKRMHAAQIWWVGDWSLIQLGIFLVIFWWVDDRSSMHESLSFFVCFSDVLGRLKLSGWVELGPLVYLVIFSVSCMSVFFFFFFNPTGAAAGYYITSSSSSYAAGTAAGSCITSSSSSSVNMPISQICCIQFWPALVTITSLWTCTCDMTSLGSKVTKGSQGSKG